MLTESRFMKRIDIATITATPYIFDRVDIMITVVSVFHAFSAEDTITSELASFTIPGDILVAYFLGAGATGFICGAKSLISLIK